MKALFPLLFCLLYSACGSGKEVFPAEGDPSFDPYVLRFENDAARFGSSIGGAEFSGISFTDSLSSDVEAGICQLSKQGKSHVFILRSRWLGFPDALREMLIYHELGHCLLLQKHRENSLMSPTLIRVSEYEKSREHYLAELFQYEGGK